MIASYLSTSILLSYIHPVSFLLCNSLCGLPVDLLYFLVELLQLLIRPLLWSVALCWFEKRSMVGYISPVNTSKPIFCLLRPRREIENLFDLVGAEGDCI